MARTNLPLTTADPSVGVQLAPTAIDVANGMNIALASGAIPRGPTAWDLVLIFTNTFAGSKSLIVRAGASNPPAFRKDIGDLSIANPGTSAVTVHGPFDPARYAQPDGSINIDFTAAATGTVTALAIPHRGAKS